MIHYFAIFFIFLLIPLGFSSAFGEVVDFTTNKSLYHQGDQLSISGNVFYDPEFPTVTIQIFNPNKSNFAGVDVVIVNPDGGFSVDFRVGGIQWQADGTYTIKITYDGNMEKSIEYEESLPLQSISEPTPEPTPEPEPTLEPEPTPEPEPTLEPEPTPNHESTVFEKFPSNFITLKFKIPNFPSLDKTPQYYIDRYNNEVNYKSWIDSQFPGVSIDNIVGYKPTYIDGFPSLDKTPQYYIDRYNNEVNYKSWIDSQFPGVSIYNILGYPDPILVPDWIRNNAEWWATGAITDSAFISGIDFMLENNIIMISNIPSSGNISEDEIPDWIRNNAHWWSQNLISEDEFVNSLKFLIQNGIIIIN